MLLSRLMGIFTGSSTGTSKAVGIGALSLFAAASFVGSFRKFCNDDTETLSPPHSANFVEDFTPASAPVPDLKRPALTEDEIQFSDLSLRMERVVLPQEPSLLFGGGTIPKEGADLVALWMKAAQARDGGGKGVLVICPYASEEPDVVFERAVAVFSNSGIANVDIEILLDPSHKDFSISDCETLLDKASGVFFGGGRQKRLSSLLQSTGLLHVFQARFKKGPLVVSGTSAGTAIMSNTMIAGDYPDNDIKWPNLQIVRVGTFEVGPGLGHVRFVMDQHFSERERFFRLRDAVLHLGVDGVGVDEATVAIFTGENNRYITALGSGNVTFISKNYRPASSDSPEFGVITIPSGHTLDTETGELTEDDAHSPWWRRSEGLPGSQVYPFDNSNQRDLITGRVTASKG